MSSSEPNVILGPWVPGTFLEPQEAPSSLPLLPASSPRSQLTPLAPRASLGPWSELEQAKCYTRSLGPWNLPGASGSLQLTPLASSSLPSLPACSPCSQSIPGSLERAGSELERAKCYTRSPCSQSIPGSLEPFWGLRKPQDRSPCFQLAPLAPRPFLSSWNLPGTSESPQLAPLAPSLLPLLPAHSPCSQSIPGITLIQDNPMKKRTLIIRKKITLWKREP